MRVYELAKQLDLESRELVARLQAGGIDVRNYMSCLDPEEIARAREIVFGPIREEKRIKPTVIRRRRGKKRLGPDLDNEDQATSNDGSGEDIAKCPVCNEPFQRSEIPAFCPTCAWDLSTDPTVHYSIEPVSEEYREIYNQRKSLAQRNWNSVNRIRSVKAEERSAQCIAEGKIDQAIEAFTELIDSCKNLAHWHNQRALGHFKLKEYDQAIRDFSAAIPSIKPNAKKASLYNDRGICYFYKKNYSKAIKDLSKGIRLNPTNIIYSNRGYVYQEQGDHSNAVNDFSKAIKLTPDDQDCYWARANSFDALGEQEKAEQDRNKAREMERQKPLNES